MKIKKEYTFTNKQQIWRLLPTTTNKLLIEERDPEFKEVFFSCIDIKTGRKFFNKQMIEEKFWIGVEKVYKDLIFFHKFKKPDMPGKKGIIAFDILKKEILWKNEDLIFLFVYNDEVFCYKEKFESKNYFKLDSSTGEIISEFGNNPTELNALREKVLDEEKLEGYYFTKQFIPETEPNETVKNILTDERSQKLVSGKIDYILFNRLLLFSFHAILPDGRRLRNLFKIIDIDKGKVIFEEELNRGVTNLIPDSFFVKGNLLFLLKEKAELLVCSLKE
jgi:hypothetical protein